MSYIAADQFCNGGAGPKPAARAAKRRTARHLNVL
jgi:hypothetical protein